MLVFAVGLVAVASPTAPPALAAGAGEPALPEPLTRDAIRDLVARLSDAEVRRLLIAQLDRAAAPPASGKAAATDMGGMVDTMEGESQRARARAADLLRAIPTLPDVLGDARARFLEGRGPGYLLVVAVFLVVMLGAGFAAERLLGHGLRHARRRLAEATEGGLGVQAGRLAFRLALDLLELAVFVGVALAVFVTAYQGHAPTRRLALTALAAVVVTRLVARLSRLLLSPREPSGRLLPFGDAGAQRLHGGLVRLAGLYGFGIGLVSVLRGLGVPAPTANLLGLVVGALMLGLALDTIWRLRGDVAGLIRGEGEAGPLTRLAAELWPVLTTGYLVVVFGARVREVFSGGPSVSRAPILSLVLLVALPLVDFVLCRMVAAVLGGPTPETAGVVATPRASFEPVLRRAVHIVVTVVGLLLLADLWGLDLFALASKGLGDRVSGALFGIAITLLVAYMLWEVTKTVIDHQLRAEGGVATKPGEEGGRAASRLRTLLPIFRMLLLSAIVVMATLSVLAALGVNILPLLAGAGVVGVAIGFGSQTLVRDIVSGAFFLADDAFRLGEYVEIGDTKGTVEKISVRSLHVRHHRGALNVLPYGEIKRLRNTSRDWMIMVLEFRLTYDTDLLRVKKIIKKIGEELAADPELGPELLEPLKSQGVTATEDSALLVRAKFMARPGSAPYLIRREAYTRILKAFAENGIKFAHRQVTVFVPDAGGTPGAAVPPAVAGAGAAGSLDRPRSA